VMFKPFPPAKKKSVALCIIVGVAIGLLSCTDENPYE